jgi:hypothetical protein
LATTSSTITTDYVDLLLSADGDLVLTDGDLTLVTDTGNSLTQRLRLRFNIWKTEWIYNVSFGMPFFQYIGKGLNKSALDAEFKRQILLESDVETILSFTSIVDRNTRSYACGFEVQTSEGTVEALAYYLNDSFEYTVPEYNIGTCQIVADTITFGNKLYKLINFDLRKLGSSTWITEQMLTEGYGASGYGEEYGD